jgi:hypothetical protein
MDPIFISEAQSNGANAFEQKFDPHILEGALPAQGSCDRGVPTLGAA